MCGDVGGNDVTMWFKWYDNNWRYHDWSWAEQDYLYCDMFTLLCRLKQQCPYKRPFQPHLTTISFLLCSYGRQLWASRRTPGPSPPSVSLWNQDSPIGNQDSSIENWPPRKRCRNNKYVRCGPFNDSIQIYHVLVWNRILLFEHKIVHFSVEIVNFSVPAVLLARRRIAAKVRPKAT